MSEKKKKIHNKLKGLSTKFVSHGWGYKLRVFLCQVAISVF